MMPQTPKTPEAGDSASQRDSFIDHCIWGIKNLTIKRLRRECLYFLFNRISNFRGSK